MTKNISLVNYKDLTPDGLIKKKLMKEGFGPTPFNGLECSVHYSIELLDGRFVENTLILKEPHVFILGKLSLIPGLEIGIRSMRMGETSSFYISAEYSYQSQDKHKSNENVNAMKDAEFKLDSVIQKSKEELDKMEAKDAKQYMPIIVEVELEKFDQPRPKKASLSPEDRAYQALQLKNEGNDLFKLKRYQEAIVKYKDGINYLTQMPTQFLTEKVQELQNSIYLNISNCHIGLLQYTYALKNLQENIIFKRLPKVFYFKAVCHMHLGDYDDAYTNLKELETMMPNDPTVTKAFEDLKQMKERTLNQKKEISKKGLFADGGLYSEKEKNTPVLPLYDMDNLRFYIDFLIDNNDFNPFKIKIELFNHTEINIKEVYDYVSQRVKKEEYNQKEIAFDFSDDGDMNTLVIDDIPTTVTQGLKDKWNIINIYEPIEPVLLLLHHNPSNEKYTIEISCMKLITSNDYCVIGRCYYNPAIFSNRKTEKVKGVIKITDLGFCLL